MSIIYIECKSNYNKYTLKSTITLHDANRNENNKFVVVFLAERRFIPEQICVSRDEAHRRKETTIIEIGSDNPGS